MDDFQHLDDHALLGVSPSASPDEIKQAYRREITKYHPDRYRHADSQTQQYARERSQRLTEAYAALSRNKGQRLSTSSRSQFERTPAAPSRSSFTQPTASTQIADWYEQAAALLAAGRADEALKLLRRIQRVDPFYRDVDALAAEAEQMEVARLSSVRAGRQPLVWIAAAALGLVMVLGGAWGAGLFDRAQTTIEPGPAVAAASPAAMTASVSSGEPAAPSASSSPEPLALATASSVATQSGATAGTPTVETILTASAPPTEVVPTAKAPPPTEVVPTARVTQPTEIAPTATAVVAARPPRAASPPAPARPPVAVESGRVLVAENFNNAASGWPNIQTDAYTLGHRNGTYAITTTPGTGAIFAFGKRLSQGNVVIGADVTPIRGSAGLLFGPDNSYRFFISGDGRYRVEQRGKALVPATASKAVQRGTNRLVIAASGKRVSLYANGVLLTNLDLPSSLEGTTYGFVVSGGSSHGEGEFDTLTVRSLPR